MGVTYGKTQKSPATPPLLPSYPPFGGYEARHKSLI